MADRLNFFFRQRVKESELDLAFELLESADRNLAADLGVYGIIAGAEPVEHQPVPNLSIDLTSPARAYDKLGQRVFVGTDQNIDCTSDKDGLPTAVQLETNERWLGLFLKFDRQLSDERIDGNSQQVWFRKDESFELELRQAAEDESGAALRVPLDDSSLLICDIQLDHGQTQILDDDIDMTRRQAFVFARADAVGVESGNWSQLHPAVSNLQATLDVVDTTLDQHLAGDVAHDAEKISYSPQTLLSAATVATALTELATRLTGKDQVESGADIVGAKSVSGNPFSLAKGAVTAQLGSLLNRINEHRLTETAHPASSIMNNPYQWLTTQNVHEQLQELVGGLLDKTGAGKGASLVGSAEITGSPFALAASTVWKHLQLLVQKINTHVVSDDHDDRYYLSGAQVGDADSVDGKHASAFATKLHKHDSRYWRESLVDTFVLKDGAVVERTFDHLPTIITGYSLSGDPNLVYFNYSHSKDIWVWVIKYTSGSGETWKLRIANKTGSKVTVYLWALTNH